MSLVEGLSIRRSERSIKSKRTFSPEPTKKKTGRLAKKSKIGRSADEALREGCSTQAKSASCVQCGGAILNPPKKSSKQARCLVDPVRTSTTESSQVGTVCNICCNNQLPQKQKASEAEKAKYFQESRSFALSLVEILQDPLAERLYCPEYKTQPCACLQKFVLTKGMEESKARANLLLSMLNEANQLSRMKCYSLEQNGEGKASNKQKSSHTIGLGNGQKRSQEFEAFVLQKRSYLRGQEVRLCERATQRVLMYSNNFLHKKLKTEPQRRSRVQRKKGKSALGQLSPVASLPSLTCCQESCVLMALSHPALLQQWRERAAMGQAEARRVLAEMLTPSAGRRFNCFKFIAMVTGVSHSTISKVNDQMKRTGGEREPPEHGLKRWWQDQAKRQQEEEPLQSVTREQSRLSNYSEETAVEEQETEEALQGIVSLPNLATREGVSLLNSHPATHFTFQASSLFSQLGSSFLIPSQLLLSESQLAPNICLSKSANLGPGDLPLLTHRPLMGTSVTVQANNPLAGALQNSQIFSQLIVDDESVNAHLFSSDLENVIIFHQPTKGASIPDSKISASTMRKLKYHEQKLLKKVDFMSWEVDNNLHEVKIMRRYRILKREDYTIYNKLSRSVRDIARQIRDLDPKDPFRNESTAELLDKLYGLGLIPTKRSLELCDTVSASSFCRRRLPVVMVRTKMAETLKAATQFIQQGHVRVGPEVVTDVAFLVPRTFEDFVTWVDTSAIRQHVLQYNEMRDDFDMM